EPSGHGDARRIPPHPRLPRHLPRSPSPVNPFIHPRRSETMIRTLALRAAVTLRTATADLRRHVQERAGKDDGYTTDTAIVTARRVLVAIAVVGIITAKVIDKANSINF